jgi:lysophospholipase L1-like esterase
MKRLNVFIVLFVYAIFCSCNEEDIFQPENPIYCVGVFGGSISCREESEIAKNMWRKELNIKVVTHGVGGAGFSNKTKNNISQQVLEAPVYDVYILWASTNDIRNADIGEIDSEDLSTQNGGIRECISLIREKKQDAQILFFGSLYLFDSRESHDKLSLFIQGQKELCQHLSIPFLDQSDIFDWYNYKDYFRKDNMHLTKEGYDKVAPVQIKFLKRYINEVFIFIFNVV